MKKLTFLLSLLVAPLAYAAAEPQFYVPEVPEDMANVDFYLLTAGTGEQMHERFGHTGIRIHDNDAETDAVFNWGRFSFNEPNFGWKFFRGSLTYSLGVRSYRNEIRAFESDRRELRQEKLNLTAKQKRVLFDKIAWNAVPEHRKFAYQYWYKNCATIPRDYLDQALAGQIKARFDAAPTPGRAYRDYVRRNLAPLPFVVSGLDVLMNGNIDEPVTPWAEMFLPERLHQVLLTMPAVDDEGRPREGVPLLSENQLLVDYPENFAPILPEYALLSVLGWLPLGLALVTWRKARVRARFLGIGAVYWGIVAGIFGLTLALNWVFSGHPDGWHNANLFLAFPVDFLFFVYGIGLIRSGASLKDRFPFVHAGRALCALHLLGLAALLVLTTTGVVHQDVSRVIGWLGAPLGAFCAAFGLVAFQAAPAWSRAPVATVEAPWAIAKKLR